MKTAFARFGLSLSVLLAATVSWAISIKEITTLAAVNRLCQDAIDAEEKASGQSLTRDYYLSLADSEFVREGKPHELTLAFLCDHKTKVVKDVIFELYRSSAVDAFEKPKYKFVASVPVTDIQFFKQKLGANEAAVSEVHTLTAQARIKGHDYQMNIVVDGTPRTQKISFSFATHTDHPDALYFSMGSTWAKKNVRDIELKARWDERLRSFQGEVLVPVLDGGGDRSDFLPATRTSLITPTLAKNLSVQPASVIIDGQVFPALSRDPTDNAIESANAPGPHQMFPYYESMFSVNLGLPQYLPGRATLAELIYEAIQDQHPELGIQAFTEIRQGLIMNDWQYNSVHPASKCLAAFRYVNLSDINEAIREIKK